MEEVRAHVFVKGKVQGVFYRVWTKSTAKDLNIYGWVKNLEDGRVEAVLEGRKDHIEEMIDRMKKGPDMSQVNDMDVEYSESTNEFDGFIIRT